MSAAAIVARARALVGVRFRLHGRDPASGLDCVGVAAAAYGVAAPTGYPLRGGDAAAVAARLPDRFAVAAGDMTAGDWAAGELLLMETGPGQLHLGVWTGAGLVHADLGLGRVVERPGTLDWPIRGRWQWRR